MPLKLAEEGHISGLCYRTLTMDIHLRQPFLHCMLCCLPALGVPSVMQGNTEKLGDELSNLACRSIACWSGEQCRGRQAPPR